MHRSTAVRLGVIVAAVFVLAGAVNGTAATSQPDLSTRAAITSYLQSLGVDPATVTWQQGLLNYAGPSCPGAGWNCTTSTKVVQIAQAGGQNTTECSGKPAETTSATQGDQTCLVVQTAPTKGENHAKCEEHGSAPVVVQVCTITQANEGGGNHADVLQDDNAATGDTTTGEQDAAQFANVHQQSDGGDNHSAVHQSVSQSLTSGDSQHQDGHQVAFVDQSVDASGNFSHVHQTQDQQETGGTTQEQNTETAPTVTVGTETFNFDCGGEKPVNPNQCANVLQQQDTNGSGGTNGSQLDQAVGERQASDVATTQTQGRFDGGQEGDIHQVNPPGLGQNLDVAHQRLAQRQSSATGVHFGSQQTDPGCCGVSQIGGAKSHEDINQATTQSATDPDTLQLSSLFGQVHQAPAVPSDAPVTTAPTSMPNNTCDIDQHGRNNSGAGHFSVNGDGVECTSLVLATTCASGGGDAQIMQPTSAACFPTETVQGGVVPPALVNLPTTATSGLDIAMPDYGEPTDYLAAIGG